MNANSTLRRGNVRGTLVTVAIVIVVVAWIALRQKHPPAGPPDHADEISAPLPALSQSAFRNTSLGVAYVGDDACVGCHRTLTQGYHQHPMGRSLFQAAATAAQEPYDASASNPFQSGRFHFRITRQGDRVIHREWCEDSAGHVVAEQEAEVAYTIGSGTQARSYLVVKDGFLFESPITWYPGVKQWRPSPGYEQGQLHFARGIDSRCLSCHTQEPRPVANATNKYRDPPFGQLAIGCERCHGPGELHVAERKKVATFDGIDDSIVNPHHLSPTLREAICQQCHLQGESIVARRGRSQSEYRPGLPLEEYISVFVRPAHLNDAKRIVGHVEQMQQSACFQKSGGTFGCTSCHDSHRALVPAERANFYRDRCRACHVSPALPKTAQRTAPDCSLPIAQRVAKAPDDNCLTCHMPRNDAATLHLAVTDHRILRQPDKPRELPRDSFGKIPLVAFHRPRPTADDPEYDRDLALAAIELAESSATYGVDQVTKFLSTHALPLLDRAALRAPNDVPVLEARASALLVAGRYEEALTQAQAILARVPDRETTLHHAVAAALATEKLNVAEEHARRLMSVYPHDAENAERLAVILMRRGDWRGARDAAKISMEVGPFRPEPRGMLVEIHLELGERELAQVELDKLAVLDPEYCGRLKTRLAERLVGPR